MDVSEKEKGILQKIVTEDSFVIMKKIASALLDNWNHKPLSQETMWLTAREAVGREERRKALSVFLETIESLAHVKE